MEELWWMLQGRRFTLREHALNQSMVLFSEDLDINAFTTYGIVHKMTTNQLVTSPEQGAAVKKAMVKMKEIKGVMVLDVDAILRGDIPQE